jgi:hypothetical protein
MSEEKIVLNIRRFSSLRLRYRTRRDIFRLKEGQSDEIDAVWKRQ